MQIRDSITVDASNMTLTRDGYLSGEVKVSRAGNVQQYMGYELGLTGDEANQTFGVYRDPNVVFDEKSMLSLAGRPITRNHPPGAVDSSNWSELAKGTMGGTIKRDGEHVVAQFAIMDADSVEEMKGGAVSASAGYTVGITRGSGTAPDGTDYQFRQSGELRFNHVAYLPDNNPRAGNTRFGDSWRDTGLKPNPPKKETPMELKTVVLGDKAVQVAVTDFATAEAFRDAAAKALADAKVDHDKAIAAKDAEIAKKDADIDALKAKVLDGVALDAAVAARGDLIAKAKAIQADVKTDGLSDAAIRKAVVVAKLGDTVKDKAEAYIDARFDILAEDAGTIDPVRQTIYNGVKTNVSDAAGAANAALVKANDDMNSWRKEA